MNGHEQYEILCAVAAAGELSNQELEELKTHLVDCSDCRERVSDFAQISAQAFSAHGERYRNHQVPSQMTSRFLERARAEGIPLRPRRTLVSLSALSGFFKPQPVWVAAALVLVFSMFTMRELRRAHGAPPSERSAISVPAPASISHGSGNQPVGGSAQPERDPELSSDLKKEELKVEELRKQVAILEQDRTTSEQEKGKLLAKLAKAENEINNLQQLSAQKGSEAVELRRLIDTKKSAEIDGIAAMAEKQIQIENLRNEIAQRDEELSQDRSLLAAGNQARNLIVARNLHIIDVHDSDGSGKHQTPFGRIFFTEGKSLVFYAYDLQDTDKLDAKVSFHVWASKLGEQKEARNLGVFRTEDAGAGRWVLTCEDPHVLAQVNTVFVTAESSRKKIDRPKGKRILYAFLGDRPNHP